jgi:hypothetical protein
MHNNNVVQCYILFAGFVVLRLLSLLMFVMILDGFTENPCEIIKNIEWTFRSRFFVAWYARELVQIEFRPRNKWDNVSHVQ